MGIFASAGMLLDKKHKIPFIEKTSVSQTLWAVLPGIAACLAILYPFYLSSGEFIYLDWSGTAVNLGIYVDFLEIYGQDGFVFRWIPFLIAQLPFVLLFGDAASAIFSKLFFLFIFALGSVGLYLLFRGKPKAVYLFSVAILCFSPFVYERIMLGQFGVVLSLMALPLTLYLTGRFLEKPLLSNAWQPAAALTFLNLQVHGLVIGTSVVLCYMAVHAFFADDRKALAKPYVMFAALLFAFNLYWLLPYVAFSKPMAFSAVSESHLEFFKPKVSVNFNTLLKSSMMYGIWREDSMKLAYNNPPLSIPKEIWKSTTVCFVALLVFLSIIALAHSQKNALYAALAIGWGVGLLLSTGISHPWTQPLFDWLFQNFPLFSSFRDSNKLVETIVIAYAVLAPAGLLLLFKNRKGLVIAAVTLVAITMALNGVSIGLDNQLHPGTYPAEYYSLSSLASSHGTTLYFPWSVYNTYNWSIQFGLDGRIASPVYKFAQAQIKSGASELDFGFDPGVDPYDKCISSQDTRCLASLNVSRIIVDYCFSGSGMYAWIGKNRTAFKSHGCLTVYEIGE